MKKITAKSGLWFLLIIPIVIYVGWVNNYEWVSRLDNIYDWIPGNK